MRVQGANVAETAACGSAEWSKLNRSGHEFESQMMKELLRPMCGRDEDGDENGSEGALADFAGEALGNGISRVGGFGIADRIMTSLSRTETQCSAEFKLGGDSSAGH